MSAGSDSNVTVTVAVRRGRLEPKLVTALRRALERALVAAGRRDVELAVSLTDDREIRELNRLYADEDHATDVLSFSQTEGDAALATPLLGDVVISVPTARRQARAGGRTLSAELLHLAVHGLVHLFGYDHATPDEERVMFGYEAKLRGEALRRGPVARVRRPRAQIAVVR